jgi:hypothetical protein
MSAARRVLIDGLVILLVGVLIWGVWVWQEGRREHELAEAAERHAAEVADLKAKAEFWAEALAAGEAQAVFRAFQAGIAPDLLAGRPESVEMAAVTLLGLPGIEFVHVLRPGGEVLYSSDAKLVAEGTAGERGAWALAAAEPTARAGATRGVTEIAAPLTGAAGPVACLWLGYRTAQAKEAVRPETLKAKPAGPQPAPPAESAR